MTQTWFITGSSRGFGRALVQAALDAGDQVVATARRPSSSPSSSHEYGDRVLPLALDVTDRRRRTPQSRPASTASAASTSWSTTPATPTSRRSRPATRTTSARQFETNFWGVYNVSKAAIPLLRAQGGGHDRAVLLGRRPGRRLPGHRQLPGRQVRGRRLQPGARGRDRAVRHQGHGRRAQRLRDRLGRLVDDDPRHPGRLRRHDRGHAAPRARQPGRRRRRPGAGGRDPRAGRQARQPPVRTCCSA